MTKQEVIDELQNQISPQRVKTNQLLAPYNTFKIGGPAEIIVIPNKIFEIQHVLQIADKYHLPCQVLGNGSNVLVDDRGLSGVVIYLGEEFTDMKVEGEYITAQGGASLSAVSRMALEYSMTGLEFAEGIPGSIGGGLFMNAGAFGGQLGDLVSEVTCITGNKITEFSGEELEFGYRSSTFQDIDAVVLQGKLKLKYGDKEEIKKEMKDYQHRRTSKQPVEYPSAGSVFKRPEGYFAGKLIEDSGLKGYKIGGAQVSEKHCGFIINTGDATSQDVKLLVEHIQRIVYDQFGVKLQRELKYLG